jgi:hypothetical protein
MSPIMEYVVRGQDCKKPSIRSRVDCEPITLQLPKFLYPVRRYDPFVEIQPVSLGRTSKSFARLGAKAEYSPIHRVYSTCKTLRARVKFHFAGQESIVGVSAAGIVCHSKQHKE